jgi:hypothetical protein
MSSAADPSAGGDSPLLDVSRLSLSEILVEQSALGGALDRLASRTRADEAFYAAFANFAPDEPGPADTTTQDDRPQN